MRNTILTASFFILITLLSFGPARADYTYTTLNLGGSTVAYGISGGNVLVGPGIGYLYNVATGTYGSPIYVPGSANSPATGISGNLVVGYANEQGAPGFTYDITTQTYTTFNAPGASSTTPVGIDGNNIVGHYVKAGVTYQFLYNSATTTWTTLNLPAPAYGISGNSIVG